MSVCDECPAYVVTCGEGGKWEMRCCLSQGSGSSTCNHAPALKAVIENLDLVLVAVDSETQEITRKPCRHCGGNHAPYPEGEHPIASISISKGLEQR